jgi:hypothetical protein
MGGGTKKFITNMMELNNAVMNSRLALCKSPTLTQTNTQFA